MAGPKLSDARDDINKIVNDTRKDAYRSLDSIAMSKLLGAILMVSEAVNPDVEDPTELIRRFVQNMPPDISWVLTTRVHAREEIAGALGKLWTSYVHQLPHPRELYLVNVAEKAGDLPKKTEEGYVIVTTKFAEAVKDEINRIIESNPDKVLDPHGRGRYPLAEAF